MPPYEIPRTCQIDYRQIMQAGAAHSGDDLIAWMKEDLVYAAFDAYVAMTDRQPEVVRITQGSFEYIYDDCASLEALELPTPHLPPEKRLVLAIGRSAPRLPKRDDSRLRGWSGPTLKDAYGPGWDRGHFIAYTLGGVVDGFELNVFVQRRSLNRGWKSHPRGRLYREMESAHAQVEHSVEQVQTVVRTEQKSIAATTRSSACLSTAVEALRDSAASRSVEIERLRGRLQELRAATHVVVSKP